MYIQTQRAKPGSSLPVINARTALHSHNLEAAAHQQHLQPIVSEVAAVTQHQQLQLGGMCELLQSTITA